MKSNIKTVIEQYAKEALRTICIAYKDLKSGEGGPDHDDMDSEGVIRAIERTGFTCICVLGIRDIIRPEVPGAVALCQKAGIIVRMVTGDNKVTALAIAQECNIMNDQLAKIKDSVMEGPAFFDRLGGLICKTCK
jgi:P-type Ca2+ transporter type 2B